MELFCIGEKSFCELFSFIGAGYSICTDPEKSAEIITARFSKNEIIIISELLLSEKNKSLENLLNDSTRVIVPIPSSKGGPDADARSTLRRLLGGSG